MLDELETLRLVSELGSLQAAAQRRRLTQSAVTRQMQRLEEMLRVRLLDRNVKPLRLTRAGQAVLARGRTILTAIDALKESVAPDAEPAGALRIGLAHGLSEPSFSTPVRRLRRRLPAVYPSFQSDMSGPLIARLRRGELDAAVILSNPAREAPAGLEAHQVGTETMAVVEAVEGPRQSQDLRTAWWVLNPEGCLFRTMLANWSETTLGTRLQVAAEAHDTALQAAFVASGLGLGLVSRRVLATHPLSRALRVVELAGVGLEAQVLVVRAPGLGAANRAVDALEEELCRVYGGD